MFSIALCRHMLSIADHKSAPSQYMATDVPIFVCEGKPGPMTFLQSVALICLHAPMARSTPYKPYRLRVPYRCARSNVCIPCVA